MVSQGLSQQDGMSSYVNNSAFRTTIRQQQKNKTQLSSSRTNRDGMEGLHEQQGKRLEMKPSRIDRVAFPQAVIFLFDFPWSLEPHSTCSTTSPTASFSPNTLYSYAALCAMYVRVCSKELHLEPSQHFSPFFRECSSARRHEIMYTSPESIIRERCCTQPPRL